MYIFPSISVAGVNADKRHASYLKDLMQRSLEGENIDLDVIVFPEPENPYDKNAIKVEINNSSVGYIPKKEQYHFERFDFSKCKKLQANVISWGVGKDESVFLNIQPYVSE